MLSRFFVPATAFAACILASPPAFAAGEILITQAKALAGNVTPGDTPGFPVTLSLPGRYQFASNIYPTVNQTGIRVAQRNVTIDLNGFELHGADTAAHGITGAQVGTTIENGTITGFKFDGINIAGDGATVENMQITSNGRHGVELLTPRFSRIINNAIFDNGQDGVRCATCIVMNSVIGRNGRRGIEAAGVTAIGNYIYDNVNEGLASGSLGNGFAHNTLFSNGDGSPAQQVLNTPQLHPNFCGTAPCPQP